MATSSTSKTTRKTSAANPGKTRTAPGFTAEERAAMQERARELKSAQRRASGAKDLDPEGEVLAKIAEMPPPDRAVAERLHALIRDCAPHLSPKTWYGMPAYARDGNVVCYFQPAHKFKTRYATFGFSDKANLDHGTLWPVAFALKELTPADEAAIRDLVKKATA